MSSLNSNTMVTLLNSSTLSGVVTLPLTTDIPFRSIMFKDFNGYTNGESTITLSTLGTDTFEDGSSRYVLSNAFESVKFYADTYHNKWLTLSSYDTADHNAANWSLYPAINNVVMNNHNIESLHSVSGYGGYPVEFASAIDMKQNDITNINILDANVIRIPYSGIGLPSTTSLQFYSPFGSNYFVTYNYYGVNVPIPIASDWAYFPAKSNVDLSGNSIFNVSSITLIDSNSPQPNANLRYQSSLLYFQNQIIGGTLQWASQSIKFTFPAPTIDWDNTFIDSGLHIYWNPVTYATSYKVMGRSSHNPYINKYTINDAIILNNSLMGLFFDYDSGPIVGSNNFDISSNMTHYNLFIFAYNGSTRSDIPTTQLFYKHDATGGLEWWPVMIKEYIGGSNIGAFTSLKTINTYTGQFTIGSYDDFINDNYPFDGAQYPQDYIGGRISTK